MLLDQEAEKLCNAKNMRERRTDGTGGLDITRGVWKQKPERLSLMCQVENT